MPNRSLVGTLGYGLRPGTDPFLRPGQFLLPGGRALHPAPAAQITIYALPPILIFHLALVLRIEPGQSGYFN